MNFGIAVHLACRGLQDPGGFLPRELEEMTGAQHACLHRAERITLIMARGGSAGEIVDPMHRRCDRQWLANVMFDEAEVWMIHQRTDIGEPTGIEIVDTEDAPPLLREARGRVWELVENRRVVFQGAVGAFLASTAPAASTGLFRVVGRARETGRVGDVRPPHALRIQAPPV